MRPRLPPCLRWGATTRQGGATFDAEQFAGVARARGDAPATLGTAAQMAPVAWGRAHRPLDSHLCGYSLMTGYER